MTQEVRFYNPQDKPYGRLSNNNSDMLELGLEPKWMEIMRKKMPSDQIERWKSVTNFVYATLLTTPSYRAVVQGAPPASAHEEFEHLQMKEIQSLVAEALDTSYTAIFENPEMKDLLAETGNAPIMYNSTSVLMGVGDDGRGLNLVGKTLELIRHRLLVSYKDDREKKEDNLLEDKIYESYIARQTLLELMSRGDTLDKYMSMSIPKIAAEYKNVYSHDPIDRSVVMTLYKRGSLHPSIVTSIENPKIIVDSLRKEGLRDLKKEQQMRREKLAFRIYADSIIESNFPDLTKSDELVRARMKKEQALEQQLATVDFEKQMQMRKVVYSLWEDGRMASNFSKSLSDSIAIALENLKIPSDDEIKEAEAVQTKFTSPRGDPIAYPPMPNTTNKKRNWWTSSRGLGQVGEGPIAKESTYKPTDGNPVLIYPDPDSRTSLSPKYVSFSPVSFHMFVVGDLHYPTVSHYVTTRLLASIPSVGNSNTKGAPTLDMTMVAAHKFIMSGVEKTAEVGPGGDVAYSPPSGKQFISPDDAWMKYVEVRDDQYAFALKANAHEAIFYKFKNRIDQDVLLSTGNTQLVWADRKDPILGIGEDGSGENFVGNYLMSIRDEVRKSRASQKEEEINTSEITDLVQDDSFFRGWLSMRLRDMCGVCKAMQNYAYRSKKKSLRMNADFVAVVMDTIYQPCSQLAGMSSDITDPPPDVFSDMVRNCTNKPNETKQGEMITHTPDPRGFGDASPETIDEIWKRTVVLLWYLIKTMKDANIISVQTALAEASYKVSQKGQCVRIVSNSYDNCVISALLNIVSGIIAFNKKFGYNTSVEPQDVKSAATILLNTDLEHEIHPMLKKGDVRGISPTGYVAGSNDDQDVEDDGDVDLGDPRAEAEGGDESDDGEIGYEDDDSRSVDEPDEFSPYVRTYLPPGKKTVGSFQKIKAIPQMRKGVVDVDEFIQVQKFIERTIPEAKNPEELTSYVLGAMETIKTARMNRALKQNRINFFATVSGL
jgi:predicted NAD-dependent protein-ADP-ribosyltransferase YbiA (DUF1768 family)